MRFSGVECDQCKKQERWEKENTLPPKWSTLTWYEQAKTAADTIAESATFCSDACLVDFLKADYVAVVVPLPRIGFECRACGATTGLEGAEHIEHKPGCRVYE